MREYETSQEDLQRIQSDLSLRQVKCSLAFFDCNGKSFSKNTQTAVVRQLEVVHAGHDTRKIVIGRIRRFAGTADNGEDRSETLEA